MFTGIVETTAGVVSSSVAAGVTTVVIERPDGWGLRIGQSIAVNGACLTVVSFDEQSFAVELMAETLACTTFGNGFPSMVNVERAMLPTDRFEGHIVQGHVDTVGTVQKRSDDEASTVCTITFPTEYAAWVVPKGSVTLNGVSLTVVSCGNDWLTVALIPHTLSVTTLDSLNPTDTVNVEFDIIGKYITKQV